MINRSIFFTALLAISLAVISCSSVPKKGAVKIVEPDEDSLRQHAEEINRLYGKLKIVSLDDIPEDRYRDYKKYALFNSAYIIVHPSYYLFFHDNNERKIVIERNRGDFKKNIVDIFIEDYPAGDSVVLKQMKVSAKRERDFLKKNASHERLVILVLPPNYVKHPEYPYRKLDEFARYLNEATKGSPSIIYIESESYKRGLLSSDVLTRLNKFLNAIEVNSLLLGGGYRDLCLKDFQDEMGRIHDIENIDLVPEICTQSPDFIGD